MPKELKLKRPIEHVLLQAGTAEGKSHRLNLVVDAQPG